MRLTAGALLAGMLLLGCAADDGRPPATSAPELPADGSAARRDTRPAMSPDAAGVVDAARAPDGAPDGAAPGIDAGIVVDAGRTVADTRSADVLPPSGGDPLAGIGAVEHAADLAGPAEGTLWVPARKIVLVTDRMNATIHSFDPGTGRLSVFRSMSNNTVGNALDPEGRLVSTEQSAGTAASGRPGRSVVRSDGPGIDGTVRVLADRFPGGNGGPAGRFNRPNDLVIRSDGFIYFTDPFYENFSNTDLGTNYQGVYRVSPDGKTVRSEAWLKDKPNGIALSPDERTLYVATRAPNVIWKFGVKPDGSLETPSKFVDTPGYVDGIGVDDAENLWACLPMGGIRVYRPDGSSAGVVRGLNAATNVTFGDDDRKTLYIATGNSLKRVRVSIPGMP